MSDYKTEQMICVGDKMLKASDAFKESAEAHKAESEAAVTMAQQSKRAADAMVRQGIETEEAAHKMIDLETIIRLNIKTVKAIYADVQIIKKKLGLE